MTTQALTPTLSATLMTDWLAKLERDGISSRNRQAHRTGVERLAEYLNPRPIEDATSADVRGFLAYLGELGVSAQSQGVYQQILMRWVSHAEQWRKKAAEAAAEAAANAVALAPAARVPVAAPAGPVLMEQAEPDATAVIAIMDEAEAAHDRRDALLDGQGESTWPLLGQHAAAPAPEPGSLAAAFDRGPDGEPREVVTIDFAEPEVDVVVTPDVSDEELPVEIEVDLGEATTFDEPAATPATPGFALPVAQEAPPSAFGAVPPASEPASSPVVASPSWLDEPAPSVPAGFASSVPSFEPTPMVAVASPSGTSGAPAAPPEAAFGAPAISFVVPPAPASSADDATPARGMPAVAAPSSRRPISRREEDEPAMDVGPSIALAAPAKAKPEAGARVKAAPQKAGASAKAEGLEWGLRVNGTERHDLDLSQIRNMAATGAIGPTALIRKPGGEWMKAGEYVPLRSVFLQARHQPATPSRVEVQRGPLAHPNMMAVAGALVGAFAGALAWWMTAVVSGSEMLSVAFLGALLGGGTSAWMSRGESQWAPVAGLLGTLAGLIAGRAAVYQTLASGVIGNATEKVDPFAFLSLSFTGSAMACWGSALVLSALTGLLLVGLRRR